MKQEDLKLLTPLVDGDILLYRCGFAADSQIKKQYKESNPESPSEEVKDYVDSVEYLSFALGNTKSVMEEFVSLFDRDTMETYLTGHGNFREQVATILPYKGNRDPAAKPKYYREIKEYLLDHWNAILVHGREADDALGCRQWAAKDRSTIICSIDKDLDMIPGHHYNFVKNQYYYVPKSWADNRIFVQMLVGDRTDNIPGIKGIGDIRATKILEECGNDRDRMKLAVQRLYKDQYGSEWERYYEEVASLLWIQREEGKECPFI